MTAPARPKRRLAALVSLAGTAAAVALATAQPAAAQQQAPSLIRDTEIEEILHKQADPIFKAAGLDPSQVRLLLVGDKELNAFAGQGQIMGLNTGLILETETPNELNGVIAHEAGHLSGAHPFRSGEMNAAGMRPFLLTMGLGVIAALAGSGEAAAGLVGSAGYFGTLGALGFSREQEGRADQAGLGFMEATGQSGKGMADFFDNFRYQEVFDRSRQFAYFRSHPLSSERIESLRVKAESLPHYKVVDPPEALAEHEIMKAKLEGFINPSKALVTYEEKDTSYPARYARAIAYYQTKEPDRALKLIDALLTEQPNNPYLWELKGQILFEFGRVTEAEGPQRKSVELKPQAPLLRVNLGRTLVALDDEAKVKEGIGELRKSILQEKDNAEAWRLLAVAYDKGGQDGLARLATAEFNYEIGDATQARIFAMRAREKLDKSTPEWRRATDIVLTSEPSKDDLQDLAKEGSVTRTSIRR